MMMKTGTTKKTAADQAGEERTKIMKTYSVEMEHSMYSDDECVGTYEECLAYAKREIAAGVTDGIYIAEIEVDDEGCATYTYSAEEIQPGIEIQL